MAQLLSPYQEKILGIIREWPTQPGVYLMRDSAKRILYVGKAKNLRNRIKSYFLNTDALTPKTRVLVKKVVEVEFTVTHTELEALLLECNLIKKHRPRYNIRLKDDKNYPYVVLDFTHPFPQFRITRKVVSSPNLSYFGPYSAGVNDISRFLLKTFQIRDCSDSKFKNRTRPCLNYEIGTCTGPCVNLVSEADYSRQVREAILFLKGRKRELLQTIRAEMKEASGKLQYEHAKTLRDKMRAIQSITQKQQAVLTDNQSNIDVIGSYLGDGEIQWVVLFIRSGLMTGRRAMKTSISLDSVEETTRSFLEQFYDQSLIPDEIWIASDFPERDVLEKYLRSKSGKKVSLRVRRSEKPIRLLGMAAENAKLLYQDSLKKAPQSASKGIQEALNLSEPPHTIEGMDVSNLQGENPAVALVHFADERPLKSRYRLFYPRDVEGQNDFAMIHEAVLRRYKNPENPPPDLLLIDGGKGQLAAAIKALQELGMDLPICALAKSRTDSGFTLKELQKSEERIFLPNRKNPVILREGNAALRLLQQVRDEAHRFSVKAHRGRRKRQALQTSSLLDIEGIGDKRRKDLLTHFGSIDALKKASVAELAAAGLGEVLAKKVHGHLTEEE